MSVALARQLREGTKKAHTMAENTGFVSCFLKGVVDRSSYRKLLADLYFVYKAMEDEIEQLALKSHPIVSSISFPELKRCQSLENDLFFYFGENWTSEVKPTVSAMAYVERIKKVSKEFPELLIGHHYTRYLGDLSGGQILKKIAQKAMQLGDHDGLRFYEFDLIANEKSFKEHYSQVLNSLPIDQLMADQIVEEANLAFKFNMDIFKELEGNLIATIGKILFQLLTRSIRRGSTESL